MGKKNSPSISVPAKSEKDYQSESDFSTLERAEEVRSNSSRYKAARAMGMKKLTATKRALGKMGKWKKGSLKIG